MPDNHITSQHLPQSLSDPCAILTETAWNQAGCPRLGTTTTIDRCALSTSGSQALCILAVRTLGHGSMSQTTEGVARARLLPRSRCATGAVRYSYSESRVYLLTDGEPPKFCTATQGGRWRAHGGLSVEWLMLPCKNMPVNR